MTFKLIFRSTVIGSAFLGVSACISFSPQPELLERHGVDMISIREDQKVAYLKEKGHLDQVCAARESDVFATESSGFSLSSSVTRESGSIDGGKGLGAEALGGRSPLVLIVREYLYRACELSMNLNADPQTRIQIYQMFLDEIAKLSNNISTAGTQAQGEDAPRAPVGGSQ